METRSGRFVKQPTGYVAFIPNPLPPDPPITYDDELQALLSSADISLGRLDAASYLLPNPNHFIRAYSRKEAVFSSQIEGTQSTLNELYEGDAGKRKSDKTNDRIETLNYEIAMSHGLQRLEELPLSSRLIREIHEKLMTGVRGQEKQPGEFRRSQNWIGGSGPSNAAFVPPPPTELERAIGDLEVYLHSESAMPHLVKSALIHSQFETIHPFLDGNGRIGRLLITFLLIQNQTLSKPILYPSLYFRSNRQEYYEKLQAVRTNGEWENWIKFFIRGIGVSAQDAYDRALEIVKLKERDSNRINATLGTRSGLPIALLDNLYLAPAITIKMASEFLNVSNPAAKNSIQKLETMGVLKELTGLQRDRIYCYTEYIDLLNRDMVLTL